jgi:hypothetical protein
MYQQQAYIAPIMAEYCLKVKKDRFHNSGLKILVHLWALSRKTKKNGIIYLGKERRLFG